MDSARLKPRQWKTCRRSWANTEKKATNFCSRFLTPAIFSKACPTNSWQSAIVRDWPPNFAKKACAMTWLCLSHALSYNTETNSNSRSNVSKSNRFGVPTVRKKAVTANFINATLTLSERILCWMKLTCSKSLMKCSAASASTLPSSWTTVKCSAV